jgi:hypothetical protein
MGLRVQTLCITYASHAVMAGMTIEVLAQQLGHKDTRITVRHSAQFCPTFKQSSVRRALERASASWSWVSKALATPPCNY